MSYTIGYMRFNRVWNKVKWDKFVKELRILAKKEALDITYDENEIILNHQCYNDDYLLFPIKRIINKDRWKMLFVDLHHQGYKEYYTFTRYSGHAYLLIELINKYFHIEKTGDYYSKIKDSNKINIPVDEIPILKEKRDGSHYISKEDAKKIGKRIKKEEKI